MMVQGQYHHYNEQGIKQMSTKELNYISDCMKNEELLTKLCFEGAAHCQNQRLKDTFEHMAQEHVQNYQHLLSALQQQG